MSPPGACRRRWLPVGLVLAAALLPVCSLAAGAHATDWPGWQELIRVLSLRDYNTRIVIAGTTLLGFAAGLSGTFLILRKRALLSDALSHATLPGIALSFIFMTRVLGEGKYLSGLIAGAAVFAMLGTGSVLAIQRYSRLKDDAALGVVLSVFFGLGIAVLGIATRMGAGNAAGLTSFIYGKTASMLFSDALLIAVAAAIAGVLCLLFFKEFLLVCFDADFAAAQGWPVGRLDFFMMTLVVVVTVVGLQAVGLILVVALLIIPPAAARFWTRRLRAMLMLSGLFGALSGLAGAGLSALMADLPAGAVIVLSAATLFFVSMLFGTTGGVVKTLAERTRLRQRVMQENLLRELYEWTERAADSLAGPLRADLLSRRAWGPRRLGRALKQLAKRGWTRPAVDGRTLLTDAGMVHARAVVRKHRLWEAYLIAYADTAPGKVDFGADTIEHVLDDVLIAELEARLEKSPAEPVPPSPHTLAPDAAGA